MKHIDIPSFAADLRVLLERKNMIDVRVYDEPTDAFEDYYGDGSIPNFRILGEPAVTVWFPDRVCRRFDPATGQWHAVKDAGGYLMVRIDQDGVLGEIVDDANLGPEPQVQEWFQVESPSEVLEFVHLVNEAPDPQPMTSSVTDCPIESLIDGVYVPFVRHLDDFDAKGRSLSWVSVELLGELMKEHLDEPMLWLYFLSKECHTSHAVSLEGLAPSHRQKVEEARGKAERRTRDLREMCQQLADRIADKDVLQPQDCWQTVETALLYGQHRDNPAVFDFRLPVRVRIAEPHFGPYFRPNVAPAFFGKITDLALAPFLRGQEGKTTSAVVKGSRAEGLPLPSPASQRRIAFESAVYEQRVRGMGRKLADFSVKGGQPSQVDELLNRKRLRYRALERLLAQELNSEAEILRALQGLESGMGT